MVKIYIHKILTIFGIGFFFGILLPASGNAIPLTINAYGAVGAAYSKDHLSGGSIAGNIKNDFAVRDNNGQNISFALGVAPNIPLPIISNVRAEITYIKSIKNGVSNNLTGASIYYDFFKLLPIVTPYVGVSFLYYNPKIALHGNQPIKEKINQGLTAFNVGASLSLPSFPLAVYGEYRYAIPGIFKNNLNFKKNDITYSFEDYSLSMFMVGVRYYFL